MRGVITLLTDFGSKDHYVASMKGVILNICPRAIIVDITHDVPKFSISTAAFILKCSYKYFPKDTIHVVVVDPGVGTKRRAITVETRNYVFVGPDNGVLMMAALDDGIRRVYSISNPEILRDKISFTFHGRDIFAPVAAHITCGFKIENVGERIDNYLIPDFVQARKYDKTIEGEVVHIDDFGNVITNITRRDINSIGLNYGEKVNLRINDKEYVLPFMETFGCLEKGQPVLIIDSEEYLELCVNLGNAAELFKAKIGDRIILNRI